MATENPTTGSVFAEYIPNSPILHGHFEMSETQPGHVPNGASPTPTATATATPDATTPAPAPAPAPATVAAPAPTPTPPTSTPAPAPASAPAQEPLAAPAAPPAPPAPTVFDTVPSTSFPPLPHISTDDFERTTDFTSTAPSAPVPSQNVANSGVPTTSFTAVNAPPAVSGPVPTSMPSPAPAPAAATAPAQTFSAPPAVATNAPIQTYSSAPAPTPAPASAPVPAPVPAPQAVSTTAPAPSQAPLSLPPTTYTPVPLSVPPPPPVATSAPPQSPSVTPGGPPPPSMSQYQSTPNVPPSNPPPMQGQPPMQSMGQYNPAYSPQMGQMGMQTQMSYQLPGNNSRSRAHQREVKRRTKTGCLTCRKRRIKVRPRIIFEKRQDRRREQVGLAGAGGRDFPCFAVSLKRCRNSSRFHPTLHTTAPLALCRFFHSDLFLSALLSSQLERTLAFRNDANA
jgi:white-opaque regulator 2